MRKILSTAAVLLGLVTSARAQVMASAAPKAPSPAGGSSAESMAARAEALTTNMTQALHLTPVQTEKVRVINTNSVRNLEAARQRYRQEPAKLRAYLGDISLARLEQLKDVFTATQFARYQQKREEKMGIPTGQGSQGTPPPGLSTPGGE